MVEFTPKLVAPCHPQFPVYAKGLCKACYMRELRNQPQSVVRATESKWYSRRVKYMTPTGLTPMTVDHFNTMIADHNGVCKCCHQRNEKDKNGYEYLLHLNWNLNTGLVRGLVCNRCHSILTRKLNSLSYPDSPSQLVGFRDAHQREVDYYDRMITFSDTVEMPD
jgi:hypothetical protein